MEPGSADDGQRCPHGTVAEAFVIRMRHKVDSVFLSGKACFFFLLGYQTGTLSHVDRSPPPVPITGSWARECRTQWAQSAWVLAWNFLVLQALRGPGSQGVGEASLQTSLRWSQAPESKGLQVHRTSVSHRFMARPDGE